MDDALGLKSIFVDIFSQMRAFAVDFAPRALSGFIVLVVGFLLAKLIERLLRGVLTRLRFDTAVEKIGIADLLAGIGLRGSASRGIAKLIYYLLLILFVQAAASTIGLGAVGEAISAFFAYLPRIVAALLILLLGSAVGQFARKAIEQSGRDSGLDYAAALGRAVAAGIGFIVAIMALAQLGIDTEMIRIIVIIGLGAAGVAFALSFGLGSREVTRSIVAGFYLRKLFRPGRRVEAGGVSGELEAVTATSTVLRDGETRLVLTNDELLRTVVREHESRS